ncbi:putative galactinol--sucrose galactosyltransferase 4 [Citrus sinensis]|uniref:Galactinol--sucrose galactosyltransferase 4 n=2 Tax=Citrus sinensis TaxID=2711 RepID=A0ACB8I9Y0_CITSI|nr:putative galactinol--sucrose galactosyltransferase 4 [Citrus sinensis]
MSPPNFVSQRVGNKPTSNNTSNTSRFSLCNRNISVDGITILSEVPVNVALSPFSSLPHNSDTDSIPPHILKSVASKSKNGAFLGLSVKQAQDRILNPIGKLLNRKFLSLFRFKIWWSTMWVGSSGSDLQMETQLILLQLPELNSFAVLIPLIEAIFALQFTLSGSTKVRGQKFSSCAYLHVGDNPYELMRDAFAAVRVHLGTFRLLEEKTVPKIVDKFGWCSWDAFYLTVEPVGLWHGVKSFAENGLPPRFLIIDDGWQSINMDHEPALQDSKDLTTLGSQMLCRLYRLKENEKFAKYKSGTMLRPNAPKFDQEKHDAMFKEMVALAEKKRKIKEEGGDVLALPSPKTIEFLNDDEDDRQERGGLMALVSDLKEKYQTLDDVYVWHALCGAWGGFRPGTIAGLEAKVTSAKLAAGLQNTMNDLAVDMIIEGGLGLVNPNQAADLYEAMHSYLADVGISGVKVDVIHTLEYVSEDHGGRVQLAKAYYDGLNKSLQKNFAGSGLIASMEQCNDFFFLATKQVSMGRVGDDFWFQDPNGDPMGAFWLQGVHMIHCSYNSLWQGQFIQPDWDMFQSDHICAEFHAGSRAICGGPVYVSDKVGHHNFDLLRKLVLPDGTILRCQHYALPTRDCLFENPLFDAKTLLKIWNLNKFAAGWYPEEHRCRAYPQCYKSISGVISADDVEWEQKDSTAVYRNTEQFAVKSISLCNHLPFELFTISPVLRLNERAKFAPIGLENMFNSGGGGGGGGGIEFLEYASKGGLYNVKIKVKGTCKFLAYSSEKPREIILNGEDVEFDWSSNGILRFEVPWIGGGLSTVYISIYQLFPFFVFRLFFFYFGIFKH